MSHASGGAFYKEFPKTCAPDDFWGQVKRTVAGKPVSQEQIEMIVAAVRDGLQLAADDFVLDLCCGNGALSTFFFAACRGGLGVDFSECLIDIAQRNFARRAEESYVLSDVLAFARSEPAPQRFTKALCYGSFQYLPAPAASELLKLMHARFTALTRLFIGNLPDRSRLHDYYRADAYVPGIEDSADTMIGIWRSPQEFIDLAAAAGWQCTVVRMPESFYAARYRYDAVLVREGGRP